MGADKVMLQRRQIGIIHLGLREFAKAGVDAIGRRAPLDNRLKGVVTVTNLLPGVLRERYLNRRGSNLPELIQCQLTRNQINCLHDSRFPC